MVLTNIKLTGALRKQKRNLLVSIGKFISPKTKKVHFEPICDVISF